MHFTQVYFIFVIVVQIIRSYCLSLFLLFALTSSAQKEYNVWVFGRNGGLDFNYNPPRPILIKPFFSNESSSSICDRNGALLFYTNGDTIFNRLNQPMLNWEPSILNQQRQSAIQGSMILPVSGIPDRYYVFIAPSLTMSDTFLRFWIVDMRRDFGLGEVVQKETPLFAGGIEAFGITQHANKLDYWIASMDPKGNFFRSIRSVNGLFTDMPRSQKIDHFSTQRLMNNKFSPDSRIFTGQYNAKLKNNEWFSYFDIFQFDNITGRVSNRILIPGFVPSTAALWFEFSPNSRFLYAFETDNRSSPVSRRVVQYDLSVWDSAAIHNSRVILHQSTVQLAYEAIRGMQLGPDGKIYIFGSSDISLSVIESPNIKGTGCNFRHRVIPLVPGSRCAFGSPYYPAFKLIKPVIHIGNDTIICAGDTLELYSGANPGDQIRWSNGDTSASIRIFASDTFFVNVNGTFSNRIKVKVAKKFRIYLGSDTAFCNAFSHILKAGSGAKTYNWNTGETAERIGITQAGNYMVKVSDSFNCPAGDTIQIDKLSTPEITLDYDSLTCKFVALSTLKLAGIQYVWSTGDTGSAIQVNQKGIYTLNARNKFCETSDTIHVDLLAKPEIQLGADRNLCDAPILLRSYDPGKHLWNNGDTLNTLQITQAGIYWLNIRRNACYATDTIVFSECPDARYYIPNAITPNGDLLNDVFRVYGENINDVQIEIYNRWGEKLCLSDGLDAHWDGTFQNTICPDGVYFYRLTIQGMWNGRLSTFNHRGTLTLIR